MTSKTKKITALIFIVGSVFIYVVIKKQSHVDISSTSLEHIDPKEAGFTTGTSNVDIGGQGSASGSANPNAVGTSGADLPNGNQASSVNSQNNASVPSTASGPANENGESTKTDGSVATGDRSRINSDSIPKGQALSGQSSASSPGVSRKNEVPTVAGARGTDSTDQNKIVVGGASIAGKSAPVIANSGVNSAPVDLARAASQMNLHSGSSKNTTPTEQVSPTQPNPKFAAVTPPQLAPNSGASKVPAPTPVPVEKKRPNFPGIKQADENIMVSDVRHKEGEGEDYITVSMIQVDGTSELKGVLWVVGEYIQRGTTGVMYMPSQRELKLDVEGKPKDPKIGMDYHFKTTTEKKLTIKRPGFEGEELIGVRIGVVDSETGKVHLARISTKQMEKKNAVKRAKVTEQQ